MSVSYAGAMSTLQTMFPTLNRQLINDVLHGQGGHMEKTIEYLLQQSPAQQLQESESGVTSKGGAYLQSSRSPSGSQPAYNPQSGSQPMQRRPSSGGSRAPADDSAGGALEADFLRPPMWFKRRVGGESTPTASNSVAAPPSPHDKQIQEDLALAQLLQNEQFMEDLANNPGRYPRGQSFGGNRHERSTSLSSSSRNNASPRPTGMGSDGLYDINSLAGSGRRSSFSDKWDSLTSTARNKLALFAEQLKKKNRNSNLPESSANYHMLPSAEDEGASLTGTNFRSDDALVDDQIDDSYTAFDDNGAAPSRSRANFTIDDAPPAASRSRKPQVRNTSREAPLVEDI